MGLTLPCRSVVGAAAMAVALAAGASATLTAPGVAATPRPATTAAESDGLFVTDVEALSSSNTNPIGVDNEGDVLFSNHVWISDTSGASDQGGYDMSPPLDGFVAGLGAILEAISPDGVVVGFAFVYNTPGDTNSGVKQVGYWWNTAAGTTTESDPAGASTGNCDATVNLDAVTSEGVAYGSMNNCNGTGNLGVSALSGQVPTPISDTTNVEEANTSCLIARGTDGSNEVGSTMDDQFTPIQLNLTPQTQTFGLNEDCDVFGSDPATSLPAYQDGTHVTDLESVGGNDGGGIGQPYGSPFSSDPDAVPIVGTIAGYGGIWPTSGGSPIPFDAMLPPDSPWQIKVPWGVSEHGLVVGLGYYDGVESVYEFQLPDIITAQTPAAADTYVGSGDDIDDVQASLAYPLEDTVTADYSTDPGSGDDGISDGDDAYQESSGTMSFSNGHVYDEIPVHVKASVKVRKPANLDLDVDEAADSTNPDIQIIIFSDGPYGENNASNASPDIRPATTTVPTPISQTTAKLMVPVEVDPDLTVGSISELAWKSSKTKGNPALFLKKYGTTKYTKLAKGDAVEVGDEIYNKAKGKLLGTFELGGSVKTATGVKDSSSGSSDKKDKTTYKKIAVTLAISKSATKEAGAIVFKTTGGILSAS